MKKEYQYLIAGAVVSAAVLLGMGIVGEEKQVSEGRFQYIKGGTASDRMYSGPEGGTVTNLNMFYVIDSQTGTVNYVDVSGQAIVMPFVATKVE